MSIIGEIIGVGTIIATVLMVIAKLLPNEKLYALGVSLGNSLDVFGHARLGSSWEKVEDFMVNSVGMLLKGVKAGLDYEGEELPPVKKEKKKDNVRK